MTQADVAGDFVVAPWRVVECEICSKTHPAGSTGNGILEPRHLCPGVD
jgi:hypothetical protein